MKLILASASPRRKMMLTASGIPIHGVMPSEICEDRHDNEDPVTYARRLSIETAKAVSAAGCWVLAADTIVHVGTEVFGKPKDDAHASAILATLAGGWHWVTTAWCLRWGDEDPSSSRTQVADYSTTRVRFRQLSIAEIASYVATGDGIDKAGGYGIQGLGAVLVEELEGSYTNVVGLPLGPVITALASVGLTPVHP